MAALVSNCMKLFQDTRCLEGGNIQSHFHQLALLCDQLALLRQTTTNQDYLDILITSLPHSYNASISTLSGSSHLSKTKITADSFKAFLLDKYECHLLRDKQDTKEAGKDKGKDEAFTANTNKKKDKDKCKVECHNCHKKGHYKADCWAKGSGKEG